MVQICEEEMLDWEQTRTVHPDPDADPDPAQEATGQKLVEALEEILAENEAAEDPPLGPRDTVWTLQVVRQATKVLCLAKGKWQPCAYNIYRWQMEQELGYLFAYFGGQEEEEAEVKARRQARA